MTGFWLFAGCAVAMVAAQVVYPGQAVYHYGWYNAIDAGLFVVAVAGVRKRATSASIVAAFGCAAVVFAGVASGLMGPDTQTVVGAPGARVHNDDVNGSLVFPLAQSNAPIELQSGRGAVSIAGGRRYTGSFVLWRVPRKVVYVDAADSAGNHLTVTQPTNASFLSPVLLMQQSTTIAGMDVRFDTFSVPASGRSVKAVLFSSQQAEQLRADPPIVGKPAVLFAVSDANDRIVRGGIALAASGQQKRIGDLLLRGTVGTYPAVVVASAPYLPVFAAGLLALAAGALVRIPYRSKT